MNSIVASQKYLTIENYCSPRRNLLLPQTKFQRIAEDEKSGSIAYYVEPGVVCGCR